MRQVNAALLVLLLTIVGCSNNQVNPQQSGSGKGSNTATSSIQRNEPGLPPPGNPVVGDEPAMPKPVQITTPAKYKVETYASGLDIPWDMAFVSKDRVYVTERPGRVRLIENGKLRAQPYATINTAARGEGGLMGIALHPDYPNPRYVYVMYTYSVKEAPFNRISRFRDTGSGLTDEKALVEGINGALYHDGGIVRFGPDGMLYAGTGDGGQPERAQDKSSLSGKILRMTPDGDIPKDNPFPNSYVYAYGLRNVQGLAWNPANGDLWATMHGPTGEFGLQAMDEVFIIKEGGNHGWPRALGVTNLRGVVPPILFFKNTAVPPALAIFYTGNLMSELKGNFFFASLRGEHLQRVVLSGPRKISRIERWFQTGTHQGKYGRLRAVVEGPDGAIYVSTSNRSRGTPAPNDDRILRISPK